MRRMNWLAILCASVAYWLVAFVWYSLLFGKIWAAEQIRHRRRNRRVSQGRVRRDVDCDLCFESRRLSRDRLPPRSLAIVDLPTALKLGAGLAVGFSITTLTIVHVWEKKSTKVWMIDASYHLRRLYDRGGDSGFVAVSCQKHLAS